MAVMREITKRLVLEECLRVMEAIKLNMSKNGSGREALEGYDIAYLEQEMKCNVIREMIRQIEAGAVGGQPAEIRGDEPAGSGGSAGPEPDPDVAGEDHGRGAAGFGGTEPGRAVAGRAVAGKNRNGGGKRT